MTQRFTQDPDPAAQGQPVKFCYETDGANLPVDLSGTWDPSGDFSQTVTGPNNGTKFCWTVQVPDAATGGTLEDESGQSDDFGITVSP